jgi:SAM-dependent methyltransferase
MLEIARKRNPEIQYLQGDMRTISLDRKFDVVAIPDSIMYMTTLEDLSTALTNAVTHLKRDGVLLVVAHTKEEFRNNNFAYTGENDNTHITVLENNHIVSDTAYEAAIVYLIRQDGRLEIHHEVHTLGLFSYDEWMRIFDRLHLKVEQINLDHLYDKYLLEDGAYKLKVFVGTFGV